jgi:hypothetical protein
MPIESVAMEDVREYRWDRVLRRLSTPCKAPFRFPSYEMSYYIQTQKGFIEWESRVARKSLFNAFFFLGRN